MTAQTSVEVAGLKESLRTLQDLDKGLRRQITKDYKEIVQPLVSDARQLIPTDAPLSGFNRSWAPRGGGVEVLPYSGNTKSRGPSKPSKRDMNYPGGRRQMVQWMKWQAQMNAFVSGKTPRQYGDYTKNLAVFGVHWQGPAAVLFDTSRRASTPQGARMVAALQRRYGPASRVIWKAYASSDEQIQREIEQLVKRIMAEASNALSNARGK